MAVTAKFLADFRDFERGVDTAQAKLRTFQDGIGRVDKDLAKFGNQFSGTRLIQEALLMEKAIREVGGTSKLTASELERAGNTAKAAAEKMRALGLDVPERLKDLATHAKAGEGQLSNMLGTISKFAPAIAGAFSVGAVVNFAKELGSFAGKMVDLSAETGIGVERLQALNYAAAGAGLTVEDITGGVTQLSKRLAGGDDSAAAAVARLGLNLYQLQSQNPDEAFLDISRAVGAIENPMERTRTAMELFGRSGSKMLRLMTDDVDGLMKAAEDSGAIIDKELIQKADQFDDAWTQAILRVKGMIANLVIPKPEGPESLGRTAFKEGFRPASEDEMFDRLRAQFLATSTPKQGPANPFVRSSGIALPDPSKLAEMVKHEIEAAKAAKKAAEETKKLDAAYQALNSTLANDRGLALMKRDAENMVAVADAMAAGLMKIEGLVPNLAGTPNKGLFGLPGLVSQNRPSEETRGFDFSANLAKNLGPTIIGSLMGGGSIGKSLGGLVGGGITEKLFGEGGPFGKAASAGLKKVLGSTIGGALGAALPGIGALAGPAIEGIGKLFGKMFGGEGKKTNDARDSTLGQMFGSQDEFRRLAAAAGVADIEIRKVFSASKVKDFEEALKRVSTQMDRFTAEKAADQERLAAAVEKYQFSFEQLGPSLQKQRLDDQAKELIEDWRVLVGAGLDIGLVNEKMSEAINSYLQTALKVGSEVPNAFRPILEQMLAQGTLTDAAGNAITDLEAAGITFSESMTEGFTRVVEKLDELISRLGLAGQAIANLPSPSVNVPSYEQPSQDGLPGFATGTRGRFLDFGAGTPVMLHGRERVMTEGESTSDPALRDEVRGMRSDLARIFQTLPLVFRDAALLAR